MSSLLNNASLLLNPAGSVISYKEDKIYSVIPRNGDGDFTFSGGDGGTRVNQDGYIEVTPANLFTYSNTFSDSSWAKNSISTTQGYSDPFGGNNAWLFSDSGGSGFLYKNTIFSYPQVTLSVYVKYYTDTNSMIYIDSGGAKIMYFNPQTGVITSIPAGFTGSMEYIKDGWYRVSMTGPIDQFAGMGPFGGGTGTYYYGAQLNIGSTALPYQPTTDRLNYPRITYQNGRGALLSEPQRTNVLTNSQNFNLTPHTLQNATVTTGSGISPDGTNNANKLISSGGTNTFYRWYDNLGALGGTYTYSIFAKADSGSMQYVCIGVNTNASNGPNNVVEYNIANGTISRNPYGVTAYIEPYKDGWYRLVHTYNLGTAGSFVHPCIAISNGTATLSTFQNLWDSTAGQYVYLWGSQYEAGEFPTTYIPTTSATVTRPLDQFFKNDSSALNTTSWTFYMSGVNIGKNQNSSGASIADVNWSFDSGGGPYGPNSIHNYNNTIYYYDTVNGAAFLGAIGSTTTKFAVTKNGTTFKVFRDGVLVSTNTLSLASNVWDSFRMYGTTDAQGQAFSNNPSTLAILPSALSDAEAQTLTTVRSGSGGNISYYGPYTIHTFTGSATFTPSFNGEVEVLVVAGGGAGGGGDVGGGGGAGGLIYASSYGVSQGTGITVTIGAGGTGVANAGLAGGNGSNSVFGGLTAIGGGGGAGWTKGTGNDGGSGGGSTWYGVGGNGIPGQGNNGGTGGVFGAPYPQCGGGGAGEAGFPAQSSTVAGNGGDGLPYSISGFSTYYAGGGGGATEGSPGSTGTPGIGGLGGGGNGGSQGAGTLGTPGVNYTGGGGGGCDPQAGANGGSGVVILRYLT
jgi:hypothetical protein